MAAAAGCSGAEAAPRDVNCVRTASQTAHKQQQQPLELIAASQLKSLAGAGCTCSRAARAGLELTAGSVWCMLRGKCRTGAARLVSAGDCWVFFGV